MSGFEVAEPILNAPYDERAQYWDIVPDAPPERKAGRRPAFYFYRPPGQAQEAGAGFRIELKLVNRIRKQIKQWRMLALRGEGGVTRTTMGSLSQGRVLVTNWHIFERQTIQHGGVPARVSKVGVPLRTTESITIGPKTTTARGIRYLTENDLRRQIDLGLLKGIAEERDRKGRLKKVKVESFRYVESDTKWLERVMGRDMGGKRNLLVINDEAHNEALLPLAFGQRQHERGQVSIHHFW